MNVHYTVDNQFTNYSDISVTIKEQEYSKNILVTNSSIELFKSTDVKSIQIEDLTSALSTKPDLIIFGTGAKIVYPDAKLIQALQNMATGVEVMTIQALCRTFNFLISENRKIAAILLF